MYHVSDQGVDERMINVHYYYYYGVNSAKLVVRGFGGLTSETFHGHCAVDDNAEAFDRIRECGCHIVKLKSVGKNGGQFLFGSDNR